MQYLQILLSSLSTHPKSVALLFIAFFNLGWVFYIVFVKKNFRKKIYQGYFFYATSTLLWVISNAYFQSSFLILSGVEFAKIMAVLANISAGFAATGFYYMSCLLKRPHMKMSRLSWGVISSSIAQILFFNLLPNFTIQNVEIETNGEFKLIFGEWNSIFFLFGFVVIILGIINFIGAARKKRGTIENIKFIYILFGMSLMYIMVIVFDIIFPTFFQNYDYVWLPPALSILDVIIVGYGILVQRFASIKLFLSNLTKNFIAFAIAVSFGYGFYYGLKGILPGVYTLLYIHTTSFFIFLSSYNKTLKLLNSHLFHDFFGITNVEYFRKTITAFQKKNIVYSTLNKFENDIRETFCEKLKISNAKIIMVNKKSREHYTVLVPFCSENHSILVTKEIQFQETQDKKMKPLLIELESLGEICLPLYHGSKALIGLLILGKKTYDQLYTKEEIETVEQSGSHLSLKLIEITYNAELQREVELKTLSLQEQNKKIQDQNHEITHLLSEKTKLLAQQSDFLAITAHELRTPLSIAMLQTDDILLSPPSKINDVKENVEGIKKSLKRLKILMDKLFDVLQYDLNKINITPEKIGIHDFITRVFEDFEPLMKEKNLFFRLKNSVSEETIIQIDPVYFRQLMQNLLTNAIKFSPQRGIIELTTKEDEKRITILVSDNGEGVPNKTKKIIFEKFKSNHTMQSPGMGLGLYICKKITALHHGKIWVTNNPGGGAIFHVELPKG